MTPEPQFSSTYWGLVFLVSALIGGMTGSWLIFALVLGTMLFIPIHSGSLRL